MSKIESVREVNTRYIKFDLVKDYNIKFYGMVKSCVTSYVEKEIPVTYYKTTMSSGKTYLLDIDLFE